MPRKPRIVEPEGIYHVYNRANNRRSINFSTHTYDYFIELLSQIKEKFNIELYAYCLMKNHYHIFLKTIDPNISEVMKYFAERYARYINKEVGGSGPVFVGRFNAKLVMDMDYFLHVLRYIHLNPVEAGIVENYDDYEWSSAAGYTKYQTSLLNKKEVMMHFLSIHDFTSFHQLGNTDEIRRFYMRSKVPNRIDLESVRQHKNLHNY